MGYFGYENVASSKFWIQSLPNEKARRYMKMALMVFLKESCSGPISHSWLTNDTSLWFSQKQQQHQQNTTTFGQLGYFETTDGIL